MKDKKTNKLSEAYNLIGILPTREGCISTFNNKQAMKKVMYIMVCLSALFACTPTEKKTITTDATESLAEYALSLDTAVSYTKRYDSIVRATLHDTIPIKAYTIRVVDLIEALGMPLKDTIDVKYNHIRVYLGMDQKDNFRLLLTPVAGADINNGIPGNDVILRGLYSNGLGTASDPVKNGSYVLDFTGPCPNSCPVNSPLNQ